MQKYCLYPFKTAEISAEGKVYGCSAGRVLSYSFGNIYEKPFNEIWNGAEAQEFRRQFFDKDYKYCNFEKCTQKKSAEFSASEKNLPYPVRVQLHINEDTPNDIEKYIMSALKNAKLINLHTQGEFFEDEKAEKLVKKIAAEYPEIKFAVCTKGAYDIEQGLKKFGILDKTAHVIIMLKKNADDDKKLIENIKYLGKLKREEKIKEAALKIENRSRNDITKDKIENEIKPEAKNAGIKILFPSEGEYTCAVPFTSVQIHGSGIVYTCCASFNIHSIGSLMQNNLDEIWNGEKAQELRRKLINNDYSMCDLKLCTLRRNVNGSMLNTVCAMPERAVLAYDKECNIQCITCRDDKYINTKVQTKLYNEMLDTNLSFLKNVKLIVLLGGEAFFSKHGRYMIKKIASENTKALWHVNTNGLLFTKENCKTLGIYGRIQCVTFSVPALEKTVYEKIVHGSNYKTVIKNINMTIAEKDKKQAVKNIVLNAVISNLNYTQIPAFAEFAEKNDISLTLSQFVYWHTEFGKDYKSVSVWDKNHPEFERFKKILKHPALSYDKIIMTPRFKEIREMEN